MELLIGLSGARTSPARAELLRSLPEPTSLAELRSFIGRVQLFSHLVCGFNEAATPLTELRKKRTEINWCSDDCSAAYIKLLNELISALFLEASNWSIPFRCRVGASQNAFWGTLTQRDEKKTKRATVYYIHELSDDESSHFLKQKDLFGFVYCLQRFKCYWRGTKLESFTASQVPNSFFSKLKMSRRKAWWLDFSDQFVATKQCLRPGRMCILGDWSRGPHVVFEDLRVPNIHA